MGVLGHTGISPKSNTSCKTYTERSRPISPNRSVTALQESPAKSEVARLKVLTIKLLSVQVAERARRTNSSVESGMPSSNTARTAVSATENE